MSNLLKNINSQNVSNDTFAKSKENINWLNSLMFAVSSHDEKRCMCCSIVLA